MADPVKTLPPTETVEKTEAGPLPVPEVTPKKSFPLMFIPLLVVLLLLVFGGVYLLLVQKPSQKLVPPTEPSPTITALPDQTANWQTYTNTKYNFRLKYPKEISLEGSPSADYIAFDNQMTLSISSQDPRSCRGDCQTPNSYKVEKINNLTFEAGKGMLGSIGGNIPQTFYEYVIPYKNKFYIFDIYELPFDAEVAKDWKATDVPKEKLDLFKQILSTLTFSPQQQATDSSTWKTYSSPKGKFRITYPSTWYVYDFKDENYCINISDVKNPTDIPMEIDPTGHFIAGVCKYQGVMPTDFPRTNGAQSRNETIKPFTLNGYTGVRGKQTSTIGDGESIFLKGSGSTYYQITHEIGDKEVFNTILSSFTMTP